VRLHLARLSAAGALVAAAAGGWQSWTHLGHERAHLSPHEAARAAAVHEGLPVALFDRWRARLARGDRWWLDVPAGRAEGLTSRGAVYRAYAVYWFLPALPARSRADATVVFHVRALR
jgi:hypothetical protein